MDAAHLLETHIKPYLLQNLGDADAILLAGSHARAFNGETSLASIAKKNSDFDFIIFYDQLPPRFPAAMFASQWIVIPGLDEPVSIDLKIIDRAYLELHAQHTHEVRRFPFLFNMIADAYPLHTSGLPLDQMRVMAANFIKRGPAPLGPTQIAEAEGKIASLSAAMDTAATQRAHAIVALEGLQMLSGAYLLAQQDWISPIGRNLVSLRDSHPGQDKRLVTAFNAANGADYAQYKHLSRDILALLAAHRAGNHADSRFLGQDIGATVSIAEVNDSNNKGDKIMLGQYLARAKDVADMDPLRALELKCVLWLTAKAYLCRRFGVPFAYGASLADQLDQSFGQPVLHDLFTAIESGNVRGMYAAVETILNDQDGITFDYLQRIYVEDLARRRAAGGPPCGPATITAPVMPAAAPPGR